jgi:hypothetical protein
LCERHPTKTILHRDHPPQLSPDKRLTAWHCPPFALRNKNRRMAFRTRSEQPQRTDAGTPCKNNAAGQLRAVQVL